MTVNDEEPEELQLMKALAKYSFCDDYKIINMEKVSETYINERAGLMQEYEKCRGSIEEDFMFGMLVINDVLKKAMQKS